MVGGRKLQQAPRLGATGRARGRSRQEARLRIWLRHGPRCAGCGELVDITPGTTRPFELDHIVPLWQGGEDTDANRQCLCVTYEAKGAKAGCHPQLRSGSASARYPRRS